MRKTLCLAGFASAALFVSNGFTQSPAPPKPEPLTLPPATVAPTAPIPAAYFPPQPVPAQPPAMPKVLPVAMEWWPAAPAAIPAPTPLITKVIAIGDVILQPGASGSKSALVDRAERLTNLLEGFVAPQSWTSAGGRGSMVYFSTNHTLVVNNEERIVRDVESWIDRLRDASRPTVRVSIEKIRCAPGSLAKLGYDDTKKTVVLTPAQRAQALKTIGSDPCFEVLTAPRMVLCENQTGFVQIGQQVPVSWAAPMPTGQAPAPVSTVFVGSNIRATPRIAPDGRTIQLRLESQWSHQAPAKPSESPTVKSQTVTSTFAVPTGGTALVPLGKQSMPTRTEWKVPVLADVPVVEGLFRGSYTEAADYELFMLVTAGPLTGPNAEPPVVVSQPQVKAAVRLVDAAPPVPAVPPALTACELVAEYRKACGEGRTEDARKIATMALSIDPKCFTEK
jgi:Bacterial type II and III secretion system protein